MRRLEIPGTGLMVTIDPAVGDTPLRELGTLYLDDPEPLTACCMVCHSNRMQHAYCYAGTIDTGILRFGEVVDCLTCRHDRAYHG